METDDTGTAMTTFFEKAEIWVKNSNEDVSFVILCSSNKTGALIESAYSSDMKKFVEDEEVLTKFRNVCAKTSEVEKSLKLKKAKKLKADELPFDRHYKQTVGQEHGTVNEIPDKIQLRSCSRRHRFLSDGDLSDKRYEISESFQESKELSQPLLPGATKVTETITDMKNTEMKAQSTSATDTKSKTCTASQDLNQSFTLGPRDPVEEEVPHPSPLDGTVQLETNSTDEVPTVTTNSITTNDYTSEMFLKEVSSMRLNSIKPLDAKEAVVNYTCPVCGSIGVLTGISTSIGPATYPDGGMADKMPGEPRAESAKPLLERSNEEILKFIQDVNGWKDESASKYRIFVRDLEKGGAEIVKGNWTRRISKKILEAMQRPYVWYDGSRVKDLLRLIRNVHSHFHDLDEDVQSALGKSRAKVWDYFHIRFPLLLEHTYEVMKQFAEEDDFKSYYKIKKH